jgi:hypothetical protein
MKEYNEAYYFLKEMQGKGIEINFNPVGNVLGVMSSKINHDEINRMQELRQDIIILLKDDPRQFALASPADGPGTELKKLLKKFGIHSQANCSCNKRADTMDENGNEWVEENIDTVVGWLQQEARKRRLPFLKTAGKILVKKAVANSRKQQAKTIENKIKKK